VLAQCRALSHLNLSANWIGAGGTERLAGVLGQCTALAHLDLSHNDIGVYGSAYNANPNPPMRAPPSLERWTYCHFLHALT
jgi:hypothetical protein